MPNMSLTKNPMPSQDPVERASNFKEVALGYTKEIALDEAARCLNCKTIAKAIAVRTIARAVCKMMHTLLNVALRRRRTAPETTSMGR